MTDKTDALVSAMRDYKEAHNAFNHVSEPKLVDAVIYRINEAQCRIDAEIARLRKVS
jgi:hypothetical protein